MLELSSISLFPIKGKFGKRSAFEKINFTHGQKQDCPCKATQRMGKPRTNQCTHAGYLQTTPEQTGVMY